MDWLAGLKKRRAKQRTMVDFKMDLDYVVSVQDRTEPNGAANRDVTITSFLVIQALGAKYPPPAAAPGQPQKQWGEIENKTDRRTVGRIQNALERGVQSSSKEKDEATISLSVEQFEFLEKLLDDWKVPQPLARWYDTLCSHCEEIRAGIVAASKETKK